MRRQPLELWAVHLYHCGQYVGYIRFTWPWEARALTRLVNLASPNDKWEAHFETQEKRLMAQAAAVVA